MARFNPRLWGLLLIGTGLLGLLGPRLVTVHPQPNSAAVDALTPPPLQSKPEITATRTACKVLTVYDGDTLGCDLDGNGRIERPVEEIRLLGIDSPEMHYSRKNPTHDSVNPTDEPWAPQASHWLESQALHKTVYLEFDQKRQDRYNRTLAFVYPDVQAETSLNAQQLAQGYAKVLFIGVNRLHETEFRTIEAQARQAGKGLWGQ